MAEQTGRTAMVAGGSGLVGSRLLQVLLGAGDYSRVLALSRRPLPLDHPRLANRVVRFDVGLEAQFSGARCQDAFCCLGTTMRDAGSEQAFRAVDQDLVLRFAQLARSMGAGRFVMLSSVGAAETSRNFYLRVKGETERALERLGFRGLDILQPSLLLGMRRAIRPLELAAQGVIWCVNPLLLGNLARYRGIHVGEVAAAMLGAARSARGGTSRYTYRELRALAAASSGRSTRL
jgi:uncharacterized protein YbjT (DUF2867 family)